MKKINVIHYEKPNTASVYIKDKLYSVSLGNGSIKRFSNNKECLSYIVDINRQLKQSLTESISIYLDAQNQFWIIWMYLDNENAKYNKTKNTIISHLKQIPDIINIMVDRSHWQNGNHFAFKHIYDIISMLKYIVESLIDVRKTKNQYSEVNYLNNLLVRIQNVEKQLNSM